MNLEAKTVHPFFSKPPNGQVPNPSQPKNNASANNVQDAPESTDTDSKPSKGRKKRAPTNDGVKEKNFVSHLKNQASLDRFTRPPPAQATNGDIVDGISDSVEISLEVDPNHDRRKRQKTQSPEPLLDSSALAQLEPTSLDWHQQLQIQVDGPTDLDLRPNTHVHTDVNMTGVPEAIEYDQKEHSNTSTTPSTPSLPTHPEPVAVPSEPPLDEPKNVTPKKQIKITKSGRLVSSPPRLAVDPISPPKKRRGRKPKHAKVLPTVTVIKYGTDPASRSAIGQKIEEILSAKRKSTKREASQKNAQPKPAASSKVTHPFFLGKAQKDAPPVKVVTELPAATPRKSAVTPGKLRAETRRDESPEPTSFYHRGLQTSKAGKQSGLNEPLWPTSENVHVRNMEPTNLPTRLDNSNCVQLALRPRKMKNAVVSLPGHEYMIARLALDLSKDQTRKNQDRTTEFAPPQDVRLPTRLLTTGPNIKRRVHEQLLARSPSLAITGQQQSFHRAVVDLLRQIEYNLTPFDEGKCEVQSWTQKYSPKSSAHVLQTGTDAVVLKDWLQSLTVMTVSGASKTAATVDVKQPPRKKRKKAFDDFIVPDDEEEEEEDMVMLPHVEGRSYMELGSFRRPQWTRDKNVILISGPHGCGKSATVHAVAKEMGFEVFEIHAGMRRSGKDIQDKVGDMTGNHLVNHKRNAASIQEPSQPVENAEEEHVDALEKDISSGRQGTMTSFFQAKAKATVPKPKPQPHEIKKVAPSPAQATLPLTTTSRTSQKQSLILIEEADILFDEDQQFWAQITKIASLSKRPIVITCNDERQIPMHDLPLAAVLRLQPPPVELATDYLLVLAGREGHILARQAVKELYQSKGCDLRASIMELDFWCQMSVGDRKGGLEWTYQRWPPGKDVDKHGQTLRVASEGTYQSGMGWLSHNIFEASTNTAFDKEEELLQEVWTDWGISPSDWGAPMMSNQQMLNTQNAEPSHRLQALDSLDAYTESLSAADIFSRVDLPSYSPSHTQPTDASQPPIPEKSRQNYTLAAPLLQIDHTTDFLHLSTALTLQTHLLIHRTYPALSQTRCTPSPSPSSPTSEPAYAKAILRHEQLKTSKQHLTRADFAAALDCLAAPPDQLMPERTSFTLTPSSFDRNFSIITLDLAPYVRSIVAHEQSLEQIRARMSDVLGPTTTTTTTTGGLGPARKPRTTRASRVALEGGVRESKRRERWFEALGEFEGVMRTGGRTWAGMGWRGEEKDEVASLVGSERDGEFEVDEDYVMGG
ncbi:hypothetical protein COCMIDRAFT_83297 [Bipolaris oryzae ATCC 44560]|uniref:AAA+ ATPase domain-containing protein n=1 Tax=Bipolaris oryzae ATCC 44560 TaxID=930090 RepID=W6ZDS0_COCMI|nr:uncharacterized protein COCMIDRAFT_83297 [Bipolaris oryzae ATCC 44560]EUC49982.1 hypothetical protein COCMIDRAFT_83297 [Bipolaris oryzae ATCC 44560]